MATTKAELTCEMLPPERVEALWSELRPIFQASYDSCEITAGVCEADDILHMALDNQCCVFGFFADGELRLAMAIQIIPVPRRNIANILGMGGRNMRIFLHHYLPHIFDWLRANGVVSLYTETNDRNAAIYMKKFMAPFGKPQSAVKLGLDL